MTESETWVRHWAVAGDDSELQAIMTIEQARKVLGDTIADEILASGTVAGPGQMFELIEGKLDRSYELNISYWDRDDYDLDDSLDYFAGRAGFARCGSGVGFGARDLHYERKTKPSDAELAMLRKDMGHFTDFNARICVWADDGQCQLDDETIEIKE